MSAVGQQVILRLRWRADRSRQTGAKFLLQEPNHLAHALQREAAPAELADDRHGNQLVPAVNATVALAAGRHDAAFIPPLQLTGGDSGQGDHVAGCALALHLEPILFQTRKWRNVLNILGGAAGNEATFRPSSY